MTSHERRTSSSRILVLVIVSIDALYRKAALAYSQFSLRLSQNTEVRTDRNMLLSEIVSGRIQLEVVECLQIIPKEYLSI